mgnify:CR=1 FL=1
MEFRDITKVEKIKALEDNDKVLVNRDGTLRQISKSDAKFGGGQVTIFYIKSTKPAAREAGGNIIYAIYKDSSATELFTPQEAYDACMNGAVLCYKIGTEQDSGMAGVYIPTRLGWQSNNAIGNVDPENVTAFGCGVLIGNDHVTAVVGTFVTN